jgi:hypothetical protein
MVEAMKTYTAEVSRGERYWLIHVPEIDRATQARTVAEIEPITRGLIGVMLQVPEDSFSVNLQLQWPGSAQAHWTRARELRDEAAARNAEAAGEAREAARELADAGLSLREIGAVLEVSYQRAGQLVGSVDEPPRRTTASVTRKPIKQLGGKAKKRAVAKPSKVT